MHMTAVLTPAEKGGFIAYDPETGMASQGETVEDAVGNQKDAVELYPEEFPVKVAGASLNTSFDVPEHA